MLILDISHHNGIVDFEKIKNKVQGVIIRCGYGKNIVSQDDKMFNYNVEKCIEYNIPFGVYLYSYAVTENDAKSEAEHVERLLQPYKTKLSFPVYYDVEEENKMEYAVQNAKIFCEYLQNLGYFVGVYANEYHWKKYLKNELNAYTKWVAKYSDDAPIIGSTFDMWQYTDRTKIDGVNGLCDMSECYFDFTQIINAEINDSDGCKCDCKNCLNDCRNATLQTTLPSLKSYCGTSIVDALESVGYKSDFTTRKTLYFKSGFSDTYIGTAKQNLNLLNALRDV